MPCARRPSMEKTVGHRTPGPPQARCARSPRHGSRVFPGTPYIQPIVIGSLGPPWSLTSSPTPTNPIPLTTKESNPIPSPEVWPQAGVGSPTRCLRLLHTPMFHLPIRALRVIRGSFPPVVNVVANLVESDPAHGNQSSTVGRPWHPWDILRPSSPATTQPSLRQVRGSLPPA